ncbi:LLM class flavin-dependent oxidoreductase [Clostridium sp. C2-6-12]|uniref:LLM class flavin-dependent oxidoreductase n=1 Tax=Clostridium sp. C2-6-12 TaxID=2698832 RepID=UPI00136872B5|nr:LLM class flavin-dependent oxidoreductase [Clostridium sp. C2-6-12]
MGVKEDIKSYIVKSGWTISKVQEELNKRNGTNFGMQNLSKKINNETLRYNEIIQIADIIGYTIEWHQKKD